MRNPVKNKEVLMAALEVLNGIVKITRGIMKQKEKQMKAAPLVYLAGVSAGATSAGIVNLISRRRSTPQNYGVSLWDVIEQTAQSDAARDYQDRGLEHYKKFVDHHAKYGHDWTQTKIALCSYK